MNNKEFYLKKLKKEMTYALILFLLVFVIIVSISFNFGRSVEKYSDVTKNHKIKTFTIDLDGSRTEKIQPIVELISTRQFQWKDYGYEDGYYEIGKIIDLDKLSTQTLKQIGALKKGDKK